MGGDMFTDSDHGADRHLLVTQRLRERRHQLGLTQKQVVTRLARRGVRTTNKTLSSFEHGAGVDVCRLPELAAVLDCTVTYLLGLTEDPLSWEPDQSRTPAPAGSSEPLRESLILGPDVPASRSRIL
jgi:transcriptional regulator with XRE-family HTH domain